MAEGILDRTAETEGLSSEDRPTWPEWPDFTGLERAGEALPPLHTPAAFPVVRDRWERLVTTIFIPAPIESVWHALTDPVALMKWFGACHGSPEEVGQDCILDFEDGEFFLIRPIEVDLPHELRYLWRWLGIGQATCVTWRLHEDRGMTQVTVTEEACNPPWDWQTWNGGGWPGILDQLAAYVRTGREWRWPWRRMGPYAQIELPLSAYEAWDRLMNPTALRFWLQIMKGNLLPGEATTIMMGDASGTLQMTVRELVQPGEAPMSFLPHMTFSLTRPVWTSELSGRLWVDPAGWGRCIFQVFQMNWESLPPALQLSERKILTGFWTGAMQRARILCGGIAVPSGPHSWS